MAPRRKPENSSNLVRPPKRSDAGSVTLARETELLREIARTLAREAAREAFARALAAQSGPRTEDVE